MKNLGSKIGWPLAVLLIAWTADKYLNNDSILNWILKLVVTGASAVWWFLTIQFPLWAVFLLIVLILIVIARIRKGETIVKPKFYNYRHDIFFGCRVSWEWELNSENKWATKNIQSYCPKDNTHLIKGFEYISYSNRATLKCPRCETSYKQLYDNFYRVEHLIVDNANKWKGLPPLGK